ncbi:MAG: hypothetical protein KatS3mg035_1368 [Bacteroidia bacterium]|nr:MAG: hypothetical protein KatS3mg035_1368 [Bacteroidia bacterium]
MKRGILEKSGSLKNKREVFSVLHTHTHTHTIRNVLKINEL